MGTLLAGIARQVAERNAETGTHYITRDRAEYRQMLRDAAGGGALGGGVEIACDGTSVGAAALWDPPNQWKQSKASQLRMLPALIWSASRATSCSAVLKQGSLSGAAT